LTQIFVVVVDMYKAERISGNDERGRERKRERERERERDPASTARN